MKFAHYEEGKKKVFTMAKAYRRFVVDVDAEQKEQGTTFESWLHEMIRYQILNILL